MNKPRKPGVVGKIAKAAAGAAPGLAITLTPIAPAVAGEDPTLFVKTQALVDMPPTVLLPYQQAWIADDAQLKICEKGRRVGLTWAEAADAVLIAAAEGGSNYFYISATQDMAREFVEACAMWARVYDYAGSEISEGLYDDGADGDGAKRYIKTYELVFPKTGRRIVALSSRPTNLRGKQGVIGIDEAAFAPDLKALLKAAMAMLLWGDKVRIWSTHDGVENEFNQLIQEVRAGKRGKASVHRVTFGLAVEQGLYKRVCLRRGIDWTAEGEAAWVAAARGFYGDDAAEELDVIPSQSGGAYLSLALISERMVPAWSPTNPSGPVLVRGKWDDAFAYLPEDVRRYAIEGWLTEQVRPHLKRLNPLYRHVFGQDFARNRDQSVITILEQDGQLVERPVLTVELANCPFTSQQQVLCCMIDGMPRFRGGAMDATGNGAALAEAAAQQYGTEMVEQVKLNDGFYLAHMPKLRAGLQDGTLTGIPRDEALRDDLRSIKLVMPKGIPKIPPADTQSAAAKAAAADGGEKTRRHGDFAIALFLARYAFTRECGEIDFLPLTGKSDSFDGPVNDDDVPRGGWSDGGGFGAFGGGW